MYFRFQKDLMTGFDPLATRSMVYDSFQVNYIAISTMEIMQYCGSFTTNKHHKA